MRSRRLGQVLVEMALAAAGVVALAFVITRVAHWLNSSLVERNAHYQDTRLAAASSAPGVGFEGVGDIHLIGPGSATTGGMGPQGPGPSATTPSCLAGAGLMTLATDYRTQAQILFGQGITLTTPVQQQIQALWNYARWLIDQANMAWRDKNHVEWIDGQIAGLKGQIRNICTTNAADLAEFFSAHGITSCEQLMGEWGWAQVDARLAWLNNTKIPQLDSLIGALDQLINGPGGVNQKINDLWNAAEAVQDQIDALMYEQLTDLDGPGPFKVGLHARIAFLQDWLKNQYPKLATACLSAPDPAKCLSDLVKLRMKYEKELNDVRIPRHDQIHDILYFDSYSVPAITIPPVSGTPGITIPGATVTGLADKKQELLDQRNALINYRDTVLQPRLDFLNNERARYVRERDLLNQINGLQWQIELYKNEKQMIKDKWACHGDPIVQQAVQHCMGAGLCEAALTLAQLEPLAGQLNCIANKLAELAQVKFDKGSQLIPNPLEPDVIAKIQWLLIEATRLEQQAHQICSSD